MARKIFKKSYNKFGKNKLQKPKFDPSLLKLETQQTC